VRGEEISQFLADILSLRVLKKRWMETETSPLKVFKKLQNTIKAPWPVARLFKIAHILGKIAQWNWREAIS